MGLDMYLCRKETADVDVAKLRLVRKGKASAFVLDKPAEQKEEIGYWRKANQIHQWFVTNVQRGLDDCEEYVVETHQLVRLLQTVNEVIAACKLVPGKVVASYTFGGDGQRVENLQDGKVIKDSSVAERLLPTHEGFFFGPTDYDEWYLENLVSTKKILTAALKSAKGGQFTYQSSW